jgi:hypothetical protein
VLLTLLGIGDEHTDIVAHLAGFLSGVAAGWAWGMLGHRVLEDSLQRVLGFVTAAILAVAWAAALNG